MRTSELYEYTVKYTFPRNEVHMLLILIEYVFTLFPYLTSTIGKIKRYHERFEYPKSLTHLIIFQSSKGNLYGSKGSFTLLIVYLSIMISLLIIGVIIYLFLSYSCLKKKGEAFGMKVAINILMLFFRYFSFFFIDAFQSLLFIDYTGNRVKDYYIRVVFLLIQGFYYIVCYQYLNEYSFHFRITNKLLCKNVIDYPFDFFCEKYDKYFLLIKILASFESNYLIRSNFFVGNVVFFLNSVLIVLSVLSFVKVFYENNLFYGLQGQFSLFYTRKFCIFYTVIKMTIMIISNSDQDDSYSEACNITLACFVSLFLAFINWYYIDTEKIRAGVSDTSPDVIICVLIQSHNQQQKKNDFLNLYFFRLFLTWLKIFHGLGSDSHPTSDEDDYHQIFSHFQACQKPKNSSELYKFLLIEFLYSFINHNFFSVSNYYHKLQFNPKLKLPKSLKSTINLIFELSKNDNMNVSNVYINEIIKLSNFNVRLKKILKDFLSFVNENNETKKGTNLIKISKDLFNIKKEYLSISEETFINNTQKTLTKTEQKHAAAASNKASQGFKSIQYIYKYSSILCRFIIESLTNTEFQNLPILNVEAFEDFLQFHYFNDNLMILSTTSTGKDINYFQIVEIAGKIKSKDIQVFSDILPKNYAKEGKERLVEVLRGSKGIGGYHYEFIISYDKYFEEFQYNFEVSQSLFKNKLLLFGFYSSPVPKTIILNLENCEKLGVSGYSKEMCKILRINPVLFEFIRKKNVPFLLGDFFRKIKISRDMKKRQYLFENINEVRIEINFDFYSKKLVSFFEKSIIKFQEKPNRLYIEVEKLKNDLINFSGKLLQITLEKLFPINETHCVFKFTYESKQSNVLHTKPFKMVDPTFISYTRTPNLLLNDEPSFDIGDRFNSMISASSANNSSVSGQGNSTKGGLKGGKVIAYKMEIIQKERKKISLISCVVYLINIILIGMCFVFLIVEINQVNLISKTNTLSFDFKSLRHKFYTVFYSSMSITCMQEDPTIDQECENNLLDYMSKFERELGFNDYRIIDFLWFALGRKINGLKEYYQEFKVKLSTKQFKSFQFLLDSEVRYYHIEQKYNQLNQITDFLTFDAAMQTSINAHFRTFEESEDEKRYLSVPFYVITVYDRKMELEALKNQNWNLIQQNIFKILSNFLNFAKTFNAGEKLIENFFEEKKGSNLVFSVLFMILFIVLNTFILIMNLRITKFWHLLFKKLIIHIVAKLSKNEVRDHLTKKVTHLIKLADLYRDNPNSLIQQIYEEKMNYFRSLRKSKNMPRDTANQGTKENLILNFFSNDSFQMKEFTEKFIIPLYLNNILLFSFYLVVILIFDIVILLNIFSVYSFRKFITTNYDFETNLYADIALVHIYRLFNTTEENIATALDKVNDNDGIINQYLRNTLNSLRKIKDYSKSKKYQSEVTYFSLDCDLLFDNIKDEIPTLFAESKGLSLKDPNRLSKIICKNLHLDKFQNFVYEDYTTLVHNLNSKYVIRTYEGMHMILRDQNFHRIYFYLLFYIQPVRNQFDKIFLLPTITSKFDFYNKFVWAYLILNIILESFVFFVNKLFISKKSQVIERYLSLFSQCL